MSVKAGLTGDLINFVICVVAFFVIGYVVAYFMIGKFHFATPGRWEIIQMTEQKRKIRAVHKLEAKKRRTPRQSASSLF